MDFPNDTADLYAAIPVAEDFETHLGFNLALTVESVDAPTFGALGGRWWNVTEQPGLVYVQGNYGKRHVHHLGRFVFNL